MQANKKRKDLQVFQAGVQFEEVSRNTINLVPGYYPKRK